VPAQQSAAGGAHRPTNPRPTRPAAAPTPCASASPSAEAAPAIATMPRGWRSRR
jgi:hypothetical protein